MGKRVAAVLRSEGVLLLMSAFLIVSTVRMATNNTLFYNPFYLEKASLRIVLRDIIPSFLLLTAGAVFWDRLFSRAALLVSSAAFAFAIASGAVFNSYLNFGIAAVLYLISYYVFNKGDFEALSAPKLSHMAGFAVICVSALLVGLFLAITTTMRYAGYGASNYDFGIFAQMYHNMAQSGKALTTCERDVLLSHFAVHVSPIYYAFLPIYMLCQRPETLLWIQAFAITSAAIPLYLIARNRGLNTTYSVAAGWLCLLYPPFFHGAYFDFHENAFLTALLFWLIYAYEKRKIPLIILFTLLTLSVKEDAALYIVFVSLYFLFVRIRKIRITAGAMLALALAYFALCMFILEHMGLGPMVSRFNNYMTTGDKGFFSVAENILYDPAYLVQQVFNDEKMVFAINMVLSLALLPLMFKKPRYLLLAAPLLIINLMPNYVYQYRIGYQYVYGSGALLIYLFIKNFAPLRERWQKKQTVYFALTVTILMVISFSAGPIRYYIQSVTEFRDAVRETDQCLQRLPRDAEVTASTFLLPHIADRQVLYMWPSKNDTEYIVLDTRSDKLTDQKVSAILRLGYTLVDTGGYAQVYRRQ